VVRCELSGKKGFPFHFSASHASAHIFDRAHRCPEPGAGFVLSLQRAQAFPGNGQGLGKFSRAFQLLIKPD
jgi:hypothetical protein